MSRVPAITLLTVALAVAGCASDQQYLESGQSAATTTALERGRFELNCPTATATVLSQELMEPPAMGWRTFPITRSEYTVGVEGCGSAPPTSWSARKAPAAASPPRATARPCCSRADRY